MPPTHKDDDDTGNVYSEDIIDKITKLEPRLLLIVFVIIVIYYGIFSALGVSDDNDDISQVRFLFEMLLWIFFIILLLLNGVSYIFKIDILQSMKRLMGYDNDDRYHDNDDDVSNDEINKIILKRQVFHVSNPKYGYDEAKAVCASYDSELATYNEMSDAYDSGADWCNYGWSDKQMGFFPTQYKKWNALQKIRGRENECGHPGVNGGYIKDSYKKMGVNCYGYKPMLSPSDKANMRQNPIINKSAKEIAFDAKVVEMKQKVKNNEISPFNHNNWSMI